MYNDTPNAAVAAFGISELPSKEPAMRVLIASVLLASLLLVGCSSKNTFVQPTQTYKAPDASQIVDNTPKLSPTQPK